MNQNAKFPSKKNLPGPSPKKSKDLNQREYFEAGSVRNYTFNKEALSVLMLCTPVFILRVPMLWFIDMTVTTCHIQYTFLSLRQFVSRETDKTQKYQKSAIFI